MGTVVSIPGLPPWALPPPAPAPGPPSPLVDPPLIQRMPDGTFLVLPMNLPDLWGAGYNIIGGWDDSTQIAAAVLAAQGSGASQAFLGGVGQTGGVVRFLPNAVYSMKTTVPVPPGCGLWGEHGSILAYSGTGPCLSLIGNQIGNQIIQGVGTRVIGITVDGSGCAANAQCGGIEAGGQYDLVLQDIAVNNFVGSGTDGATGHNPIGAYGISINSATTLTEKMILRNVTVNNCGTPNLTATTPDLAGGAGIQLNHTNVGGGSGSQNYLEISAHLNQQPGQNGLVLLGNCQPFYGPIHLRGNMFCGPPVNGCAAIVVGAQGQPGHFAQIAWRVWVEATNNTGGTTRPFTVWFGSNADNQIAGSNGVMRFGTGGFRPSNLSGTVGGFTFDGQLVGDNVLGTALAPAVQPAATAGVGTVYTNNSVTSLVTISGGTVTAVFINGVAMTGATAGPWLLRPGMTIQINWTAQPNWFWVAALQQ